MSSGQIFPLFPVPPATTAAELSTLAGASTPAEDVPVLNFDDTTDEHFDFYGRLQGYSGGGLTLKIGWIGAAATNVVLWQAAIRAIPDDTEDLDTTVHSYAYNNAAEATAPSVIGETSEETITFTNGADMDSLANGEPFILRVRRENGTVGTNMTGDARLLFPALMLIET